MNKHADIGDALNAGTAAHRRRMLARYGHAVPRYTSYPPATRFLAPADAAADYAAWLESSGGDISLYVHIPFCMRLCYYCGCHTKVVNDYAAVTDYLSLLRREMAMVRDRLPATTRVVHMHFGGGSPTMLSAPDFEAFMADVRKNFAFADTAEIGIEADPRNITAEHVKAYAASGVTRLSLGVQDFNDDVLAAVNRPQPYALTENAVALCCAQGINHINFDLMYGLPLQTTDKILKTMAQAVSLAPDRIAYFGYAHVPWMKKHMSLLPEGRLPDAEARIEQQESGAAFLCGQGYNPIGIDHFVRPDDDMQKAYAAHSLRRNFQGYTVDSAATLIGLGVSSIGECAAGYAQNAADAKTYFDRLNEGKFATQRMLALTDDDRPRKRIIEQLMCYLTVDLAAVCDEYALPRDVFNAELARLQPMVDDGIVGRNGKGDMTLFINPDYRVLARIVCEVFDQYARPAQDAAPRHAQAV